MASVNKICDEIDLKTRIFDQFFCTSTVNSEGESVCPQEGHLLLYGLITSLTDFNMRIFAILAPHFPHTTSTDMRSILYKIIKDLFCVFFNQFNKFDLQFFNQHSTFVISRNFHSCSKWKICRGLYI